MARAGEEQAQARPAGGGVCDSIIDNHGVLVCETAWHERAEADSELLRYRWRNPAVGDEKF